MTALREIADSALWYLLCLVSLGLVLGQIAVTLQAMRDGRKRIVLWLGSLHFLLIFALLTVIMDCARSLVPQNSDTFYRPFQTVLFRLPWAWYGAIEAVLLLVLALELYDAARYCAQYVTPDAIRQTVDLLPEGIAISAPDGTVVLANLKMTELCHALTGTVFSDVAALQRYLDAHSVPQDDSRLIRTASGAVWLFTQKTITFQGVPYDRLTAIDVTDRYRIIDELREKNAHLIAVQRRMKAVSELSGDMFVAQEEAAARVALHDQLGHVLLMGRHYLEHPESGDANMVYLATQQMNAFLMREADAPLPEETDAVAEALLMARNIGVETEITGTIPESDAVKVLLARTVRECAANAAKHAEGNRLFVHVSGTETEVCFTVTNNGNPSKKPIHETGGLLSLRRAIERADGSMTVDSLPAFRLSVSLPREG